MHLLFVDANPLSARELHSEFLDYRGVQWSLSHCDNHREAIELMQQGSFQSVLYHSDQDYDRALIEINELLQSPDCPPVVAVTSDLSLSEQLNLVCDGSDECFNLSETSGQDIMRHLRMAEMRSSVCAELATQIADGMLPEISVDQLLAAVATDESVAQIDRTLRIAHVAYRSSLIEGLPFDDPKNASAHYDSIKELLNNLEENVHRFDALIVEQSTFERASESDTVKIQRYLGIIPGVVLTMEKSDFAALSYLERGYSDCLVADQTSSEKLMCAIRKSVVRRRRALLRSLSQQQVGSSVSDRRSDVRDSSIRRCRVRFNLETAIVAIPVLPNGAPDLDGQCDATTRDVSLGGFGVFIPSNDKLPRRNWIVGVQQANGTTGYASAYLRRITYQPGGIAGSLVFHNQHDDFLGRDRLSPQFNTDTGRLATNIPSALLDEWVQLGVLSKHLVRKARCCPECDAVCSVAAGCSQCGDFDLQFTDLIHHFACAHVADANAFEQPGDIECPKCLCKNLVAGADFEIIRSHYQCQACEYQGDATAQVGCCLNCQLRFPLEIANESEVYGYDVERMDILAIVDNARQSSDARDAAADF